MIRSKPFGKLSSPICKPLIPNMVPARIAASFTNGVKEGASSNRRPKTKSRLES